MSKDEDFANQWLYTVKTLFDLEDINKNGMLEKEEFKNFILTLKSILSEVTTSDKCDAAWTALSSLSPGDNVSWNDFCKSHQIVQAWSEAGKLVEDLEKMNLPIAAM